VITLFYWLQGIFITKVSSDGPAAMSLRPGDKVLEVGIINQGILNKTNLILYIQKQ
jgi:hypothetical protein